ncbi:MAG: metal-dependent hydrolase [Bacteroidota bacterium]|nr:metal-dependent hydrolase [Bacteroidota bacterium]
MKQNKTARGVKITWLGHSAFMIESPKGIVILLDPWLDNPRAPSNAKNFEKVDLILLTHGHGDHFGNTVELAKRFNAKVICNYEISLFLQKEGVTNVDGINKSGTTTASGIAITMVDATHSSTIEHNGELAYGGEPSGYVIRFENGFTLYDMGDTGVFGDMKLIAHMYKPDAVLVPIGGLFTMGPREAAKACEMVKPKMIIPMHYGTFPVLAGTPAELKKYLPASMRNRVVALQPGESAG